MVTCKKFLFLFIVSSLVLFSSSEKIIQKKIALFYPPDFPFVDASPLALQDVKATLTGNQYEIISSITAMNERLNRKNFALLFFVHGSAFPLQCWPAILRFIKAGGNLLIIGGAPFHQPVLWDKQGASWVLGVHQPAFARKLLIGPAEPLHIPVGIKSTLQAKTYLPIPGNGNLSLHPSKTFSLTVRFTTEKEFSDEDGSSGPYLAVLRPLVHLISPQGTPLFCPLLEIDRIRGPEAGGRWIFAPTDGALPIPLIRACVNRARQGATRLEVYPEKASMSSKEKQSIHIHFSRPGDSDNRAGQLKIQVLVTHQNKEYFRKTLTLQGNLASISYQLPLEIKKHLQPGLYNISVSLLNAPWSPKQAFNGFWIKDNNLLLSSPPLTVSKDWFRLGGKVLPIIGTSHMCSINQRKFLLLPNARQWNEDFSKMREQGINFIRTGIWTGWRQILTPSGDISDSVLRALDAYILSAANNGIHLCFTFFAFLPPNFNGTHPYLDPISVKMQHTFIKQICQRYRGIHWIHYDLINEPSYAAPKDLWLTRPIGDAHEMKYWQSWLGSHHGLGQDYIRQLWQDPGTQPLTLPQEKDFTYSRIKTNYFPRKAYDFILFVQDVFQRWASRLNHTIKTVAGDVLVTVGQDEGGTGIRPGQQFFYPAVDYTSVHTWWYNNDLLWDGIVTKVPEKPNLISETGLMRLEDINGNPWRNPYEAASLLERKFAYAFASRGAGVVQWLWNINPYQPLDNESVIGIYRVDGTAKPELQVIKKFADFFTAAAPYLDDFLADEVALILPHTRLFCARPMAMNASKEVIRILANHFNVFPMAISDHKLDFKRIAHCKLLIVPTPELLPEKTAAILLLAAKKGIKILVTGGITGTPYGEITKPLAKLGARNNLPMLNSYEATPWFMPEYIQLPAIFNQDTIQSIKKGIRRTKKREQDDSNILLEPLPLEFSENKIPFIAMLKHQLLQANISFHYNEKPLACRLLSTDKMVLAILINESSEKLIHQVVVAEKRLLVEVDPGRTQMILVDKFSGKILATTFTSKTSSATHKHLIPEHE